jgi:hypothetical protein
VVGGHGRERGLFPGMDGRDMCCNVRYTGKMATVIDGSSSSSSGRDMVRCDV